MKCIFIDTLVRVSGGAGESVRGYAADAASFGALIQSRSVLPKPSISVGTQCAESGIGQAAIRSSAGTGMRSMVIAIKC